MLGRLFKQESSPGLNSFMLSNDNPTGPSHTSANSFDDSYTREILYGTKEVFKPIHFNNKFFRMIVAQDGGSLRMKQVLYDSTSNEGVHQLSKAGSSWVNGSSTSNSKNILSSKIHHNQGDLCDYMFGCGLPTSEQQSCTKIHILPVLNNNSYGNNRSVLVTRLFSISNGEEYCDKKSGGDKNWNPKAALPIRESSLWSLKSNDSKSVVNSRFALGVIIPIENLEDSINDVLFNNWNEFSHYMIILQKILVKKLTSILDLHPEYIVNKRIQLPQYIIQNEGDLNSQLLKLIKLINYDSNTTRLLNINDLMTSRVKSSTTTYHTIYNWVSEVMNWLEFKDGKVNPYNTQFQGTNSSYVQQSFLANLIALILPLKDQLKNKPLASLTNGHKDICRIVIMTGNPMVAKKLIFILNGLIPDGKFAEDLIIQQSPTKTCQSGIMGTSPTDNTHMISPMTSNYELSASPRRKPYMIPENDWYSETSEPSSPNALRDSSTNSPMVKPIPIRQKSESNSSESFNSFGGSIKGWEIPFKSSSSLKSSRAENTQTIPIIQSQSSQRATLSKSTSMAYLSSSLNSSLSSSASNYSLSKLSGSFLDKWKNSFGSSFTNTTSDSGTCVGKRSFRTPSPAVEHEEFNWNTPNKLSKAQSLMDMHSSCIGSRKIGVNCTDNKKGFNVKRTKTSIFQGSSDGDIEDNKNKIKKKCQEIFNIKPTYEAKGNSLVVEFENSCYQKPDLVRRTCLSPNVAFSEEFRPEFSVQSCPVNPRLENMVLNSMKNDLLFFQNNCGVEKVTSKTIFISLRAREIKLIEMQVGGNKEDCANEIGNQYKTTIRKVFTPHKSNGDEELVKDVELKLHDLNNHFINKSNEGMWSDLNSLFEL